MGYIAPANVSVIIMLSGNPDSHARKRTLSPCFCAGGQNTIIQSLLYGIPLILFPGGVFERRYNAEKVEEAGCGIMGEVKDFNVEWLISSLKRRSEFVNNAKRFSERIRSYEGAVSAVRTFEQKYSSN